MYVIFYLLIKMAVHNSIASNCNLLCGCNIIQGKSVLFLKQAYFQN